MQNEKNKRKGVRQRLTGEDVMINTAEAAQLLGLSPDTLRTWDRDGKLKASRTKGNHRRYKLSEIRKLQDAE